MKATLWDGSKQLDGELELRKTNIAFTLADFPLTNLNLEIKYKDIKVVKHYRLYNIAQAGLEIICKNGRRNVFILEDMDEVRKIIKAKYIK